VACFTLSGFAALVYQTAWLRQLSLAFGTSELAVATTLAAYMAGLALGAAVAGRFAGRVRRPVLVYGLLEAGIAGSALAVPALLEGAARLYAAVLGGQAVPPDAAGPGQAFYYLAAAFLILALPTGLMGATLPLLTRHAVRNDRQLGARVALLYAANTAGAVLGALAAGFVLLPTLGLRATVWVGVGANLVVFGLAALLARGAPALGLDAPRAVRPEPESGARRAWILPLMLVSGANAFLYEVLWTRLLAHVLGGSVQAFATMLAAFLAGIALGGGLAGRLAGDRARAARAFGATQVGVGLLSLAVYTWIARWVPEARTPGAQAAFAAAVLLPATLCIGATFPLAVRILARDEREAPAGIGRVYAWNTVGGIAGAILAGFLVIPGLGFEGSIRLAVCVNLALAVLALARVASAHPAWPAAALGLLLAVALLHQPARPLALIAFSGLPGEPLAAARELFYAVGRSSTVRLVASGGLHQLSTNGLPEGVIRARGSPPGLESAAWLTALPALARSDARAMLVIGFGGGTSLEGVPPAVADVDVVELEPEVIAANRVLAERRERDPLADPRVHVITNDARNALRLTSKRYDAIVSQPSHPWTAGASHLFTREFVRLARERLRPGGVFVQWMDANLVTEPLLRSLAATLASEFPQLRLYRPTPVALIFLASDAPLELELALAEGDARLARDARHYRALGIGGLEDLIAALALDAHGVAALAAGAPPSSDDHNRMATRSRSRADGLGPAALAALLAPHDPLLEPGSWVHARLGAELGYAYLAERLLRVGLEARAVELARIVPDPAARLTAQGALLLRSGDRAAAEEVLRAALAVAPDAAQARWLLEREALAVAGPSDAAADALPVSARAVVQGWRHARAAEWQALAALDSALAEARIADAWYPDAARLRAEWRLRAAGDRNTRAGEALELVDAGLHASSDAELRRLRLECAIALGDADLLAESARSIARGIEGRLARAANGLAIRPAERAYIQRRLAAIEAPLAGPLGARHEGTQEVLGLARALRRRLEAQS
jgi:spermidine synthase